MNSSRVPSFIRDVSAILGSKVVVFVLGLVWSVITARVLLPEGKGELATLLLLLELGAIVASAGFRDGIVVHIRRHALSSRVALGDAFTPLVVFHFIAFVAVFAGIYLTQPTSMSPEILLVLVAGITLTSTSSVLSGVNNARHHVWVGAGAISIRSLLTLLTFLVLAALVDGTVLMALLAVGAGAAAALVMNGLAFGRLEDHSDANHERVGGAQHRSAALTRVGVGFLTIMFLERGTARLDLLLVRRLLDAESAGYYSIALTAAEIVLLIPASLAFAVFPRVSDSGRFEVESLLRKVLSVGIVSATGLAAAVAGGAWFLVPLVFGDAYRPAIMPTVALMPASILLAALVIMARIASGLGRIRLSAAAFSATVIAMLTTDMLVIPAVGLTGAALGVTCGSIVGLSVLFIGFRRDSVLPSLELRHFYIDISYVRDALLSAWRRSGRG